MKRYIQILLQWRNHWVSSQKRIRPFLLGSSPKGAFDDSNEILCKTPILRHLDPKLPIDIHTDATGVGFGALLIQQTAWGEPTLTFASKTLNLAQRNYSATELELFAVVYGTANFQQYLSGNVPLKEWLTTQSLFHFWKLRIRLVDQLNSCFEYPLLLSKWPTDWDVKMLPADILGTYPINHNNEPLKSIFIVPLLVTSALDFEKLRRANAFRSQ